jgi:carbon-monoxide dehydrogenase medium subunit
LRTVLAEDEWIDQAEVRHTPAGVGFGMAEFARRAADFAICGAIARVESAQVTVAFFGGSEMPRPLPLDVAEDEPLVDRVAVLVDRLAPWPVDAHASGPYRRHLAIRLAIRAIDQARDKTEV